MASNGKDIIGKLLDSKDAAKHERKADRKDQQAITARTSSDARDASKAAAEHRAQARKLRGQ